MDLEFDLYCEELWVGESSVANRQLAAYISSQSAVRKESTWWCFEAFSRGQGSKDLRI